ncbi:MAG: aldose 1-epimerase family protein [Clostridia bacterium]|nr:aldose 1-epimerase family protein [Clostridia bacterium]
MITTIENEFLTVAITDLGAELQSVKGKKTGFEYLWQGDEQYWKNRSTVLFPICGRLFEGKYTYGGKDYEMVIHGIAKLQTYTVIEKDATHAVFECKSNDETRKSYPFDFTFRMTYTLTGNTVREEFTVVNTGNEALPFSVGGHPGFNIPFVEGEKFEDYYLEFDHAAPAEKLLMSPTCFYTGKNAPFALEDGKILNLRHDLFADDAIFLSKMDNTVSLKSRKNDRKITVHFEDMNHVGFWQKPNTEAPYLCIEPWHGVPSFDGKVDDFATKNEMLHLPAGAKYSTWFDITVTE